MIDRYKHLGFISKKEDLQNVGHKNADEIIKYLTEHPEIMTKDDEPCEETDFVPSHEYDECAITTMDSKYIIVDRTLRLLIQDWKSLVCESDFYYIDIYEKY